MQKSLARGRRVRPLGCKPLVNRYFHPRPLTHHSETPPEKAGLDIDEELITARRALRTASWAAIFYLITTDILGPFNAPFAFSQVGYVPGSILYVVSEYHQLLSSSFGFARDGF